ncbi:MAG: hypothetical protein ACHQF2_10330, partial [Flavobacteriales bacterium]
MKKRLLLVVFSFTCIISARAQFGNEWINFTQNYYSFKIISNGVYRIDSLALSNAGINLTGLDPRNFQVFGRQREIPVYVSGEQDGVFNATDFIELYAFKNDGWLDTLLYKTGKTGMPDLYYS